MYLPTQFKEERTDVLHAAIRQARLGTLVTLGPQGLEASHVPMLVDPEPAPYGTLRGHIAKANGQWRAPAKDVQALAMFLGPHAYVTPSWYATKKETGKVVPTWNYVAIHAYGPVEFFDDPDRLMAVVTGLTDTHEKPRAEPWAVSDAPADFLRAQLKGIVGFALPIARLEGKWKMSQNRTAQDRDGVIEGLAREGGPVEAAVSGIVAAALRD
ncbi:MAG: FMN-binding negative transcriptional regulator [Alphaproteobacteria bacterium]|nr:FMN-binding negative transcriptional regulator [Alphaproteobacteria bacterium]